MAGCKRVRLRSSAALALCLLPFPLFAAEPAKHCVWRVTNVPAQFYLVGSFHNLRGDDYPLPEIYRKALTDSKRLLFEYNPQERELYASKFLAAGRYRAGGDIRDEIHPETLRLLLKYLHEHHIRFDDVKDIKPWALAFRLLSVRGFARTVGRHGVDDYFSYQARRLRKEVGGLESVQEHVAFWENMFRLDAEHLLLAVMLRGDKVSVRFDETRVAWKSGDINALSATNASLRKGNRRIAQSLLDRRNRRWLPRIEAEMKTGIPTAIVAGAGHFSGENSVVDLLQKRGYKIEQL